MIFFINKANKMIKQDSYTSIKKGNYSYLKEIMKQYIPTVFCYLMRLLGESINLVFISNKPTPEIAVTAAVGLGNATINLVGFSIIYGINSALDTFIS